MVRELITQMTTSQDLVKEWKKRFKIEKLSHGETRRDLKCILQENKEWKQKYKCIEEVAKEVKSKVEYSIKYGSCVGNPRDGKICEKLVRINPSSA